MTSTPCYTALRSLPSVRAVRPLEIRDANQRAALTLTLARAGSGTGEGSFLSRVCRGTEVMNTLW